MSVQLFHGDCLDVMRTLPPVDATITDPPYGINVNRMGGRTGSGGWRQFYKQEEEWDKERPSKEIFDIILKMSKGVVIWGGNYFADMLPASSQWLVWDKGQRDFSLADGEIAWTNSKSAIRIFTYSRAAMIKERVEHSTQKPVALMKWCIEMFSSPGDTILDPFMGSGTTGVACVQLGRNFIGIEKNAEYFAIAKKRIEAAQLQIPMFTAPAPAPTVEQSPLWT